MSNFSCNLDWGKDSNNYGKILHYTECLNKFWLETSILKEFLNYIKNRQIERIAASFSKNVNKQTFTNFFLYKTCLDTRYLVSLKEIKIDSFYSGQKLHGNSGS